METIDRSAFGQQIDTAATRISPFNGLRPFELKDASYFYGRDDEIQALLDSVWSNAYTVVYGPTAIGKSSLLRAGLYRELWAVVQRELAATGRVRFLPILLSRWSDLRSDDAALLDLLDGQAGSQIAAFVPPINLPIDLVQSLRTIDLL